MGSHIHDCLDLAISARGVLSLARREIGQLKNRPPESTGFAGTAGRGAAGGRSRLLTTRVRDRGNGDLMSATQEPPISRRPGAAASPVGSLRRAKDLSRQIAAALLVVTLPLIVAACDSGPTEGRVDAFAVGAGPELEVSNGNGDVRVIVGAAGTMKVRVEISRPDELIYEAEVAGNVVTVRAERKPGSTGASPRADIVVTVPADTSLTLVVGNGKAEVSGVQASGTLTTGNGGVSLTDVFGDFVITAGNGTVELSDVEGKFQAHAGNGDISAKRSAGAFTFSAGNGDIDFLGALTPGGTSSFTTGNGSVTVEFDGPPNVEIDAEIQRKGRVTADLDLTETTRSDEKRLIGTVGEGAADLIVRTGTGDISIRQHRWRLLS